MWNVVASLDVDGPSPSARSKHSATLIGEHVYLLGGRNGNLPMKDFWKYNLVSGKWQQLKPSGDKLPSLQEHSTVAYKDCLYVFGGEVGFSAGTETPLWQYDIKNNSWKKMRPKKGVATPKGRRGHSALIYRGNMLIYGGYQDLMGSSSELWAFHFETESWHLLSKTPAKSNNSDNFPPSRHKHSATIHDNSMWIYGGMTDLQERSDLWKFDLVSKCWTCVKTKISPGPLHSHAISRLPSSMVIFGGERSGHPTNEVWKFNFSFESWEKINVIGSKPQPRSEAIAFTVSDLLLKDQNSLESKQVKVRARTCTSADRGNRHSSYLPNNRIAPEHTYVFQANQNNYVDGSDLAQQFSESKTSRSFLQEISKLSQMNIGRLNNKCSYSVLTGCNTDSTESLLRQASPQKSDKEVIDTEIATPTRGTLVKSKSAYVIKKKYDKSPEESKENGIVKKRVEFDTKTLTREPISVPNFSTLVLSTPVLTPIEATKLVYLTDDEEPDLQPPDEVIEVKPTEYTNLRPVKRGESYSSHLGYADNPLYQHMISSLVPEEENVSSTSDYASIETMNRLSSASNYSVKTNTPQDENLKNKIKDKEGPFGFCNPNYLGPDLKALITTDNSEEKKSIVKILSKPEKINDSEEDLLELQTYSKVVFRNSRPPKFLPLESQRPKEEKAKSRALSAGRERKLEKDQENLMKQLDPFVPIYIYVMGGKEQGQITVFQRPISIWKLKLF